MDGPAPTTESDWSVQATDTFVSFIDSVRDKTTGPALKLVHALVHAMIIVTVALAALTMLVIGSVRLVSAYLPGDVWAAHLLIGTIFTLGGLFLWSKRRP
jgi:hypothetical protein